MISSKSKIDCIFTKIINFKYLNDYEKNEESNDCYCCCNACVFMWVSW